MTLAPSRTVDQGLIGSEGVMKISIVTIAFNAEATIADAVQSVVNQVGDQVSISNWNTSSWTVPPPTAPSPPSSLFEIASPPSFQSQTSVFMTA
jgi:hypothetical protein